MQRRWPDAETGPFALRLIVEVVDGRLGIVGLELYGDRVRPGDPVPVLHDRGSTSPGAPSIDLNMSDYTFPGSCLQAGAVAITTTHLRDLKPPELLDEWRAQNQEHLAAILRDFPGTESTTVADFLIAPPRDASTRGRRKDALTDDHYKKVAEIYRAALAVGKAPLLAIMANDPCSKSAAAKKVAKCRALGLLPPTTRGKTSTIEEVGR